MAVSEINNKLCCISYNTRGFGIDKQNVCKLLAIRDEKTIPIICVQEHFLLRSKSYKVKQCLPDNHIYFKSAVMDSDLGMFIAVPSEIHAFLYATLLYPTLG